MKKKILVMLFVLLLSLLVVGCGEGSSGSSSDLDNVLEELEDWYHATYDGQIYEETVIPLRYTANNDETVWRLRTDISSTTFSVLESSGVYVDLEEMIEKEESITIEYIYLANSRYAVSINKAD